MNSELKAPKTIYLQVEDLSNLDRCTWCEDKINDTDVEYTRTSNQDNINRDKLIEAIEEYLGSYKDPDEVEIEGIADTVITHLTEQGVVKDTNK